MKLLMYLASVSYVLSNLATAENAIYEASISNAKVQPSLQNVIDLGGHLRGSARHPTFKNTNSYFEIIQETLLAIPGHAQYFADEIEREQKAVAAFPTGTGPRVSYDRQRAWYFETLSHLPSPETIAVLGNFLADDKDKPLERISRHSDWGENASANSENSAYTLIDIGLRNPPVAPAKREKIDPDVCLVEARAWWEEIKSGRNTFSFLGQKVEYRFKPDGTWDTLSIANPPDDAPKRATINQRLEDQPPSSDAKPTSFQQSKWSWLIGGVLVLLAGRYWLNRKNQ